MYLNIIKFIWISALTEVLLFWKIEKINDVVLNFIYVKYAETAGQGIKLIN